jgi:hypothetical protein
MEKTGVAVPVFVICVVIVGAIGAFAGYKMAPTAAPAELADGSVTTPKLADGAVTPAKLASEALARMPLLPLASENLANGAVTTSKLADNAVTLAKLASDVVSRLGAPGYGLVTTDNIADGAVTSAKIADNAVTWGMIAGKPIEIVAAGYIHRDGSILQNFNIASARYDNSIYKGYEISLIGITYSSYHYITIATAVGGIYPRIVTTGDVFDNLWILLRDDAGNPVQDYFQFVTYKIA